MKRWKAAIPIRWTSFYERAPLANLFDQINISREVTIAALDIVLCISARIC
jgi:hypothetical protein